MRRPRGRATPAHQSADVSSCSRAHYKILQKNRYRKKKRKTGRNRTAFSENYEGPRTNRSTYLYQRLHVWTRKFSPLTREIRHGPSRPDPHETRVSGVNRSVAGRVGSRQEVFEISRVGSGQIHFTSLHSTSHQSTPLHSTSTHFTPNYGGESRGRHGQ